MGEIIVCSCRSMNTCITQTCLGVMSMLLSVPRGQSCLWGRPVMLTAGSRVHVLVVDYASHARGGMPVYMLAGHASQARGGMPVTDMLACMPVMLAGACQSRWSMLGMLSACLKHDHAHEYDTSMIMPLDLGMPVRYDFLTFRGEIAWLPIHVLGFGHDKGMIMPWSMRACPCSFPNATVARPGLQAREVE